MFSVKNQQCQGEEKNEWPNRLFPRVSKIVTCTYLTLKSIQLAKG